MIKSEGRMYDSGNFIAFDPSSAESELFYFLRCHVIISYGIDYVR